MTPQLIRPEQILELIGRIQYLIIALRIVFSRSENLFTRPWNAAGDRLIRATSLIVSTLCGWALGWQSFEIVFLYFSMSTLLSGGNCWYSTSLVYRKVPIKDGIATFRLSAFKTLLRSHLLLDGVGMSCFLALVFTWPQYFRGSFIALYVVGTALCPLVLMTVPPTVVLLAASSEGGSKAFTGVSLSLHPLRVVALLGKRRADWIGKFVTQFDNLRTMDDDEWRSWVKWLTELSPIVIVDTRVASPAVAEEVELMLRPRNVEKALFIVGNDGEAPAIAAQTGVNVAALNTTTEAGLAETLERSLYFLINSPSSGHTEITGALVASLDSSPSVKGASGGIQSAAQHSSESEGKPAAHVQGANSFGSLFVDKVLMNGLKGGLYSAMFGTAAEIVTLFLGYSSWAQLPAVVFNTAIVGMAVAELGTGVYTWLFLTMSPKAVVNLDRFFNAFMTVSIPTAGIVFAILTICKKGAYLFAW